MGRAIALSIAGSDSSGGAGIQADLKTFSAFGVYGATVVTALTAQNTTGVTGVFSIPAAFITRQFDAVASDLQIRAVKTGMIGTRDAVIAVCDGVARYRLAPLIVDPVMVATSGDVLLEADAIAAVRERLVPLADLLTPNLAEAATLLGGPAANSSTEMEDQARALIARFGASAILLKGGHCGTGEATDVLVIDGTTTHLTRPRLSTANTHGTGCTLSAAIAALAALGQPLPVAVAGAKEYVWQALRAGKSLGIGVGHGPVDHLYSHRPGDPLV